MTRKHKSEEGLEVYADRDVHIPVLLPPVLGVLFPLKNKSVIDATFGRGGYSAAILEAGARYVLGIDRDPQALEAGAALKEKYGEALILCEGVFSQLDILAQKHLSGKADGVVMDIGVSSPQLDDARRGFSFQKEGPLDMRMSQKGQTAADIVNTASEEELADILYLFGEERKSRKIARAIVNDRKQTPFTTTLQLAQLLESVLGKPKRSGKKHSGKGSPPKHPATRTFQALRLYVNNELGELVDGLCAAERILSPGGVLAVVTFHSLEDRIVKRFFAQRSGNVARGSRHLPEQGNEAAPSFRLETRKAILPTEQEICGNPRARSAKLRYGVRTDARAMPENETLLGKPYIRKR